MEKDKLTIEDWNLLYNITDQRALEILNRLDHEYDDNVREILYARYKRINELSEKILDIFRP